MKKIFFLLAFLASVSAFGQHPIGVDSMPLQTIGNKDNLVKARGAIASDSGFVNATFPDTISANRSKIKNYPGAQIRVGDSIWIRNNAATRWVGPTKIFVKDDLTVDTTTNPGFQTLGRLHSDGLVSGGIMTSAGCMDVHFTSAVYYLNNGTRYISPATTLTVGAADLTDPRKDLVVGDTLGNVTIIPGTPSPIPSRPYHNPASQWILNEIYIPAGATCLAIGAVIIYDETGGTEYTPSTSGTITTDPVDAANPSNLTVADFVSVYNDGAKIIFTKPSGQDTVFNNSVFRWDQYLNGGHPRQIQMQLFLGAVPVTGNISVNPYFSQLDTNIYRVVAVPSYAFGASGNIIFDQIVFTLAGDDLSGANGFYLDFLQLQTGINNVTSGKGVLDFTKNAAGDSIILIREDGIRFAVLDSVGTGGGGSVTDVTGTAPIISSGGSTPAISADTTKAPGRLATYSDVTIDQALRRGNTTKQKMMWEDSTSVDSSGISFTEYRPRNYGRVYASGTGASFTQGYGYYPGVNADGRPNMVGLFWGYNGGFNTPLTAGESTWGFRTETHFQITGVGNSEFHLPEFKSKDGVSRRINSMYVNNTNGYTIQTQQIDSYSAFQGVTDTAMFNFAPGGANFGFNTNGALGISNRRSPNNSLSMSVGDAGPTFSTGTGVSAAATYIKFASPALFTTHATLGTSQATAIQATIATAGYNGLNIVTSGLAANANFNGVNAGVTTTGVFKALYARNLGAGIVQTQLEIATGGTARYTLSDQSNGYYAALWYKGGNLQKSVYLGTSATDSAFKMRGDNGDIYLKYNAIVGSGTGTTAPTSTLSVNGSLSTAYRAITALRTLDATDNTIECTANTFTVTLPTAVSITGREYWITNTGSGTITIGTTSSQTFINVTATPTTLTVAQFTNYKVVSNGSNWLAYKIVN